MKTNGFMRILSFLLCLIFVCALSPLSAQKAGADGTDPGPVFHLYTAEDLKLIRENPSGTFYLENDINMEEFEKSDGAYSSWTTYYFPGKSHVKLYGNGHALTNLDRSLFEYLSEDADITGLSVCFNYVGESDSSSEPEERECYFADFNRGAVSDCEISVYARGNMVLAGAGFFYDQVGMLLRCTFRYDVEVAAFRPGYCQRAFMEACRFDGNVYATRLGCGVADNQAGITCDCTFAVNYGGETFYWNAAGPFWYNLGTIVNCVNTGSVRVEKAEYGYIGGISATSGGLVVSCANYGNIYLNLGDCSVGGVLGSVSEDSIVDSCYNYGVIQSPYYGTTDFVVGGFSHSGSFDGDLFVSENHICINRLNGKEYSETSEAKARMFIPFYENSRDYMRFYSKRADIFGAEFLRVGMGEAVQLPVNEAYRGSVRLFSESFCDSRDDNGVRRNVIDGDGVFKVDSTPEFFAGWGGVRFFIIVAVTDSGSFDYIVVEVLEQTETVFEKSLMYSNGKCCLCERIAPEKALCPGIPFWDVKKGSYYRDAVKWAISGKTPITKGTSATLFSPDSGCTRGQVVTFLWRAAGCPEPKGKNNPFTDVSEKDYYCKAVMWAAENGITAGVNKTTFAPDATCTRCQIVTFLWRAKGSPKSSSSANPFSDVKQNDYFRRAVMWAVENGITKGTSSSKFSPYSTCTRAQVVTFLYRDMGQ